MPTTIETLPGGTQVLTSPRHLIGTDALLLAKFCEPKPWWNACDLGAGGGIVLLALLDAGLRGTAVGVERDEEGHCLLQQAVKANQLGNLHAVHTDVQQYQPDMLFDLVASNPPYFSAGPTPPTARRAAARHEVHGTLEDFAACASRILKDGGRFCVCYPATRMAHLMHTMQNYRLAPKRVQLVRKSPTAEPWLVLLDARKAGGIGLSFLPDIILPPGQAVHY